MKTKLLKNVISEMVKNELRESNEESIKKQMKALLSDIKNRGKQYNMRLNPKIVSIEGSIVTIDLGQIASDFTGSKILDASGRELDKIKGELGFDFTAKGDQMAKHFLLYTDTPEEQQQLLGYLQDKGYKHQITKNKKAIRVAKKTR